MTNRAAINAGLTIDRLCPNISHAHLKMVAELLALKCEGNPHLQRQWRLERLRSFPRDDQKAVAGYVNQVIEARKAFFAAEREKAA